MPRAILAEEKIHPAVRERVARRFADVVGEVQQVVAGNAVVVVGMGINPHPRRARRMLEAAGIAYRYLSYGSYLSQWPQRTALKMWSGWPTFPMVFVGGTLVGGASDLEKLIASGELLKLVAPAQAR
jgi:monothiol glutaredoxin